eukprot:scaffold485595_cov130-Attheya_sp.AAC.1
MENSTNSIIYISFNGLTSLSDWEYSQPLEALLRRILFAALGDEDTRGFRIFNESTVVEERDVTDWLGDTSCILLIDELNLVEDTMNAQFAIFLKENFLQPAGRALVFSSHVISMSSTLTLYMHSPSDREVKTKKLPVVQSLARAKSLLRYPALSPHQAVYLGLIPALFYESKLNHLPHQRREYVIQEYLESGVTCHGI